MGGKDSKPAFITYEEAIKRVTDSELKRLKDAFKRCSTLNGYLPKGVFTKDVLGDGVPNRLAEQMYLAFGGGQKGLNFKDLVCGLVLLTRGRQEEKLKFIFGLYANESLTHVQKEEVDALVLATEGHVPPALSELFRDTDRVPYEYFRGWVLGNQSATSVIRWMLKEPCAVTLSNDLETPTFYQTLAGVTHLEETDIIELEKRYWLLKSQSKTGRFDLDTFNTVANPPVPESLCEGLFNAFDENRDNHIDFKEMACGISACCRGPLTERQKFCFKVFDTDQDGLLSLEELEHMVKALLLIRQDNHPTQQQEADGLCEVTPAGLARDILKQHAVDQTGHLTQEGYLLWTVSHTLSAEFLNLLFQVCHVVLGLKPQNREDEGQVIVGWMNREDRRGLVPGQTWYLVAMPWWKQWLQYVKHEPVLPLFIDHVGGNTNGSSTNNNKSEGGYRKSHNRSGSLSLCPQFPRKSITQEESSTLMTDMTYSSLPRGMHSTPINNNTSPTKYATLPHSATSSPATSRAARLETTLTTNHVSPAQSAGSTPSHSPRVRRHAGELVAPKPGVIDNSPLIVTSPSRVMTLTNEGGKLRKDRMLARSRDFELVPEPVWKALSAWYGGNPPPLPRNVIKPTHEGAPDLELYPIFVRLLKHQTQNQRPNQASTFTGMMGGLGGMVANSTGIGSTTQAATPRRYLAFTAAFSRRHTLKQVYDFLVTRLRLNREDMRLWKYIEETNMMLLEEEEKNMEELGLEENMQVLIEVRNSDLTWPEEMSQLAKNKSLVDKTQQVPTERGATGLNNLGNTCFMNSAVQCVSNTRILTLYFTGGMHLYELNRMNPLGMKGHIAQRYGDLVKDLWSGTAKCIAPLKLRWTIGKYAPRFNGFQQHDAQELLAFLLDGLHEDLNRVHDKPYVELKDSDNRPDAEVAKEALENHMLRNRSIVVDLFHGQLKSCVRCIECGHTSVRFDPFTFLSLPLPMESCIHLEIILMRLDGSVPVKYGLRLNTDEKYKGLKKHLSQLSNIPAEQVLLAEVFGATIKSLPQDNQKIKGVLGGSLFAYELPSVAPIPTMSAEEEKHLRQGGLSLIQRMHRTGSGSRDGMPAVNGTMATPPSSMSASPLHSQPASVITASSASDSQHSTPVRISNSSSPVNNLNCKSMESNGELSTPVRTVGNGLSPKLPNGNVVTADNSEVSHQRNLSNMSATSNSSSVSPSCTMEDGLNGFVIAVHRKMIRNDLYYLSSQKSRPSLFGTPLILPCEQSSTRQDLYQYVWTQVARLVSPLPPSEAPTPNHAQDCDDSLGYEYPFSLKVVQKDGMTCAWCPWYRFCKGCTLACDGELFKFGSCFIAVDWEPTALHLRYQTSQERVYQDHESVEDSRRLQTEPIDLDTCLKAFTKEEELGEDELYYCSKCKTHRQAIKKLDIWRLPPVLIIHLKRFQLNNNRWVKSQKIVQFPLHCFDPSNYVVPRSAMPSQPSPDSGCELTNHTEQCVSHSSQTGAVKATHNRSSGDVINNRPASPRNAPIPTQDRASESNAPVHTQHRASESNAPVHTQHKAAAPTPGSTDPSQKCNGSSHGNSDASLSNHVGNHGDGSSSDSDSIKRSDNSSNHGNKKRSLPSQRLSSVSGVEDYSDVVYDLYALSCHMGILGGGHYVAYAKNPNDKWYMYNDSSCKEITEDQIDRNTSYILFYERRDLDYAKYMPNTQGKHPDANDIEDDIDSDFKKMCTIQ